jgi:RNA polymerase sigma factor (sigma-70 family)
MHASDPDRDRLEFGLTGDMNRAMQLLMQRHGRAVHRYCCKQLNDAALADDVRQEVFIAALRNLPRFEGRSTLRTWLFAIARHRTSDAVKRRKRQKSQEVELTEIVNRHDPAPRLSIHSRGCASMNDSLSVLPGSPNIYDA